MDGSAKAKTTTRSGSRCWAEQRQRLQQQAASGGLADERRRRVEVNCRKCVRGDSIGEGVLVDLRIVQTKRGRQAIGDFIVHRPEQRCRCVILAIEFGEARARREEGAGARVPRCRVEGMEGAEGHVW